MTNSTEFVIAVGITKHLKTAKIKNKTNTGQQMGGYYETEINSSLNILTQFKCTSTYITSNNETE